MKNVISKSITGLVGLTIISILTACGASQSQSTGTATSGDVNISMFNHTLATQPGHSTREPNVFSSKNKN